MPTGPGGLTPLHACAQLNSHCCVPVLAAAGAVLAARLMQSYERVAEDFAAWPLASTGRLQLGELEQQALQAGSRPLDLAAVLGRPAVASALLDAAAAEGQILTLGASLECTPPDLQRLLARRLVEGQLAPTDSEQLEWLARSAFNALLEECLALLQAPLAQWFHIGLGWCAG